ncbi:hypothetical protein [Salinispora pacifica]|uniref:hypothetical protein n=1 Tax=Salinispora pacifica TaxID=351187 RepID=UPI001E3C8DD6|nr:hypothetical protein [Salinispora pacifica]
MIERIRRRVTDRRVINLCKVVLNRLNLILLEILEASNPILSGVAYYFRHAAVKRTPHYLTWFPGCG